MHDYARNKEKEITNRLNQLKQEYEPYKAQEDINLLLAILPTLGENLRMAKMCKGVGLTVEAIKKLFRGKTLSVTGNSNSAEHNRSFNVQDAKLQILKEQGKPNEPDKYRLSINGQNIIDWFKEQFSKLRHSIRQPVQPQPKKGRGM